MGVGTRIRRRLSRWEIPAAKLYRGLFIDIPALAERVAASMPATRILEVGCGDGVFAEELTRVYPGARYLGTNIAEAAGRLYRGDPDRARFRVASVHELMAEHPDPFDLVCLVDVVHHIPARQRREVTACAAALTAPGGHLVVKEWERDGRLGYRAAFLADRFITGDRDVSFLSLAELRALVDSVPGFGLRRESRVPPLRNNVLCTRRRLPAGSSGR